MAKNPRRPKSPSRGKTDRGGRTRARASGTEPPPFQPDERLITTMEAGDAADRAVKGRIRKFFRLLFI